VWKVNADEQPEVVHGLGIVGIPSLIAFKGGKEITRKVGAGSGGDLRAVFEAALSGEKPARRPISLTDRGLRLVTGTAIVALALSAGPSLLLLAVGGVILFTAVADRCPIWQAISPRIASVLGRKGATSN
jgi:hypothetical protein